MIFVSASQPAMGTLRTVPEAKDNSKPSLGRTICACTLCSCTMSLQDLPAHNRGRRHQLALSKVDASLRPLPESVDIAPAVNRRKDIQGRGIVGSDETTSTAGHFNSLAMHNSAGPPVGSSASEPVTASTFPTEIVKQKTKKAKRSKEVKLAKSIVKSTATPPASTTNDIAAFNPFLAHLGDTPTMTSITKKRNDPLQAFFVQYAPFKYNPRASSHDEFKRLCAFFGWPSYRVEPNHEERTEAWQSFRIAMVQTFNVTFGYDECDVEAWGRMCVLVDMEDIPEGLRARRDAMINTHVNLSDLLDTALQGTRVHVFASEGELREYTKETGRIFPKEDAYAGGLLKYLLRQIFRTYHGHRGKTSFSRRKREKRDDKRVKGAEKQ